MASMTEDEEACHALLLRFVSRQELVARAIEEIWPHKLTTLGRPAPRPSKEVLRATSHGRWGADGEWDYGMHGAGCRLLHRTTGEPIEWDEPDLSTFDVRWFGNWIDWLQAPPRADPSALLLGRRFEQVEFLERLASRGYLEWIDPDTPPKPPLWFGKYRVITEPPGSRRA